MTKEWPKVRLGRLLRRSEVAIKPDPEREYREITVRLWGRGVIERGRVDGATIAGTRRFVASAGQLIVSRIDARNGAIGIVPETLDGALVSNDFPLFDADENEIDARYLGWLGKTANFVELCKTASEGTTNRVRLQEERFLALEIALPPVGEQRRVVAKIEALAGCVSEARQLRQESSEALDNLIVSAHLSFAGERKMKLGDILRLDEEAVPVSPDGQYPQVGVRSFGAGLFAKSALAGTETTYKAFNRLYRGAVVMSQVKGWEGAVAVCPPNLSGWFVSPEYRTFRCVDGEASPAYLAELVRTRWFWSRLAAATQGVGARRERTKPERFLSLEMLMPTLDRQLRVVKWVDELHELRRFNAAATAELQALLPAVLDRAFNGKSAL